MPSQPTVKKYYNLELVGELEATKVQEGVYCIDEQLDEEGHYGYVAVTGEGGYDVVNIHVVNPFSPPETIETYVIVTHEEGSPPEEALLIRSDGVSEVGVSQLEPEISYVGPISIGFGSYWLKIRWPDGMEIVLSLSPFVVVEEEAEKRYRLAKRLYLVASLQMLGGGRALLPLPSTVE